MSTVVSKSFPVNDLFPLKGILPTIANPVASFPKLLTTVPPKYNFLASVFACTLKSLLSFTIVVSVFVLSEILLYNTNSDGATILTSCSNELVSPVAAFVYVNLTLSLLDVAMSSSPTFVSTLTSNPSVVADLL